MNLSDWLERIQALHPTEIELGLDRVSEVAKRLGLSRPAPIVITVAGTNGKGSTVAMLAAILHAAGQRVGTYTSPHIHRYNERISLLQEFASDEAICTSFARIDAARRELSLSYFEFSTLAGLILLEEAALDVAILEVGLGGRLDAVNMIDADIAIITSIGIDHQDWLGDTRELIAIEKAGILRPATPFICGDEDPPETLLDYAQHLGAPIRRQGLDYAFEQTGSTWTWWHNSATGERQSVQQLPLPGLDLLNAATVLETLRYLPFEISQQAVVEGLKHPKIEGRYQQLHDSKTGISLRVDVAHNPHAALQLAKKLSAERQSRGANAKVRVLLAMMRDKDHEEFYTALESVVDFWYIAAFDEPRCLEAEKLAALLQNKGAKVQGSFDDIAAAYQRISQEIAEDDLLLVTGSFVTVADIMQLLAHEQVSQ